MLRFLLFVIAVGVSFAASAQQRTSTFEERLHIYAPRDGQFLRRLAATDRQVCARTCIDDRACHLWTWSAGNCSLFANAISQEANGAQPGSWGGVLNTAPKMHRIDPLPTAPEPPAAAGLFPLPKPGVYVGYQVERAQPSYAVFRILRNEGHASVVERKIWEGNYLDERTHRGDLVLLAGGEQLDGPCRLTVDAAALRTFIPGATPDYERHCTGDSNYAIPSTTVTTVLRSVTGRKSLTLPAGRFDGIEVTTRSTSRGRHWFRDNPGDSMEEVSETITRRLWVESLGFYVEQVSQNRLVSRVPRGQWVQRYTGHTSTSTEWHHNRFFAIEVQNR